MAQVMIQVFQKTEKKKIPNIEYIIFFNRFTQRIDEYLHRIHRMKRAEFLKAGCSYGMELVMAGSDLWKSQ